MRFYQCLKLHLIQIKILISCLVFFISNRLSWVHKFRSKVQKHDVLCFCPRPLGFSFFGHLSIVTHLSTFCRSRRDVCLDRHLFNSELTPDDFFTPLVPYTFFFFFEKNLYCRLCSLFYVLLALHVGFTAVVVASSRDRFLHSLVRSPLF